MTFNVVGYFTPVTIKAKIMLQRLWNLKLGWDDTVPDDLTKEWQAWRTELPEISNDSISRIHFDKKKHYLQLHGLTHVSQVAYGGVVYLHAYSVQGDYCTINVTQVVSKSRVATFDLSTRWCLYYVKTPIFLAGSMFRPAKPSHKKRNHTGIG